MASLSSEKVYNLQSCVGKKELSTLLDTQKCTSEIFFYGNRPLSDQQKAENRERSKTRAKVEHVFGTMVNEMSGKLVRTIGLARAEVMLGLKNLTYNLKCFVFWQKQDCQEA